MKRIIIGILFMILSFSVVAESDLSSDLTLLARELTGKEIPSAIEPLFGNERVNFYIEFIDGTKTVFGLVSEEGVIKGISQKEVSNPSLKIYLSESAFIKMNNADDPLIALAESIKSGEISYSGVGFFNKLKFSFMSIFSKIDNLFGEEAVVEIDSGETETKEGVDESDVEETETINKDDTIEENDNSAEMLDENSNDLLTGEVVAELPKVENTTEIIEDETEKEIEEEPEFYTYNVELVNTGFGTSELDVFVGDSVIWENVRSGSLKGGMIIGTRNCKAIKSKVFNPGESYSYTFQEPGKCLIVDGIFTTQIMYVNVAEK
jgi:plastocyanin